MIKDYSILGLKNLKRRGIRSWLTLLGIVIGIAAVVALISLGNGLKLAVNAQFGIDSTNVITVQAGGLSGYGPPGTGVTKPLTEDDAKALEKISGVLAVVPRLVRQTKIEYADKLVFGYVVSVPDGINRDYSYQIMGLKTTSGRLLKDGDTNKINIGANLALSSKNGFDKAIESGSLITINGKKFQVTGINEKKGSFIFDSAIFMNQNSLKDLVNSSDTVDMIGVLLDKKASMNHTKDEIEKILRQRRDVKKGEEDFQVSTPEAMLGTVNSILSGVQIFIAVIASMSILVGALGIINTMTTAVIERRREIGIMKAIGATNYDIFLLFLIEAGLLGLIGGIIGIILGSSIGLIGTSQINNFLGTTTPLSLDFFLIISVLVSGFLIGAAAGIIPALRAANQNPVEVLRG